MMGTDHLAADCFLLPDEFSGIFRGDSLLGKSRAAKVRIRMDNMKIWGFRFIFLLLREGLNRTSSKN